MKNKEFYKLLKKNKSNSGFTLTELLVGLFMSIFVIGALGFGLMTVLATSQSENSKVKARTENSRALDFVSDEVRRARNIESFANSTNAPNFTTTGKTVVLALDIPEISNSVTIASDNVLTTSERVVYYLKSNSGTNWKGPQVLYRWGPTLEADGSYSTTNSWGEQALIDGINSTTVSSPCTTGTVTPTTPTGFYACLSLQDSTATYDAANNPRNTAQLFLTGQTKTASGINNDSQTNDTQVVARARTALAYKTDENKSVIWSVEGLGGDYKCKDGATSPVWWHMRTDFSNSATPATDPNKVSWTQNPNSTTQQQPQPIEIKDDQPLTITSNPINATGCNSSGTPVAHAVTFGNPTTFNGVCDPALGTGSCPSDADKPRVKGDSDQTVQFFKKGSNVPSYGSNELGQRTLGKFLYDKGWAIPLNGGDPTNRATQFKIITSLNKPDQPEDPDLTSYLNSLTATQKAVEETRLKLLGEDQRIIGFEIGVHASTTEPGFDLQDNIFIVTSNVFKQKFAPSCFSSGNCNPSTGKPNPT